jgi:hypothetical protein
MCVNVHPVEPLITGYVISIATTSRSAIPHKLLSIQEKLDFINKVVAT